MYTYKQVYKACLLAITSGDEKYQNLAGFGNANKNLVYRERYYQEIAEKYYQENISENEAYDLYYEYKKAKQS